MRVGLASRRHTLAWQKRHECLRSALSDTGALGSCEIGAF